MAIYSFYNKTLPIKFIVRNIANKQIKVFAARIPPGLNRDLLALPYVSESDIKNSLIKGELKHRLDVGDIEIVESNIDLVGFESTFKNYLLDNGISVGHESQPGPIGVTGPAPPKQVLASTIGIAPGNTGEENSDAFDAWRNNTSYFAHELVFDNIAPGASTYSFDRPILIPLWRKIKGGSHGVILKYTGSLTEDETPFVGSFNGGPNFIEDLTITVRDGNEITGLMDYVIESHGTLSPNTAGPTMLLKNVYCQFGNIACIRGLNNTWVMSGVQTYGGPKGLLLEGCSESTLDHSTFFGHEISGIHIRGSGAAGSGLTNGGKFTAHAIGVGSTPGVDLLYGLDLEGVANCVVHGITVEGASVGAIRCRSKTTNVWVHGARSNAGAPAIFDNAFLCKVDGACTSTQIPLYINNARMCAFRGAAESFVAPVDIIQKFGALEWRAHIRPDGVILSLDNTAPTDGFWEVGTIVWRRTPAAGQPQGWRCTVAGNPGTWLALPNN